MWNARLRGGADGAPGVGGDSAQASDDPVDGCPTPWPSTMDCSVAGLRGAGFEGFVPFDRAVDDAPEASGVYVVARPALTPPAFLPVSPAGSFTGRDPSYPPERLEAEWVAGSAVVYVGKAGRAPGIRRGLRARLREYAAFGSGKAIAHRGGRAIWHLDDAAQLLVAWRATAPRLGGDVVQAAPEHPRRFDPEPLGGDPRRDT
ncbi:hypothetical protein [Clavibacter michiganensis]|uniref:hypothetical protein n=2 Tax=Clavibacter michiganensis TaxID=28447 RepID=UPI0026DABC8E|nr:hypothetical protein [Clavibacter michiganensis]MDO4143102.1 hypothetical protein [Clavibacter michiganensis]